MNNEQSKVKEFLFNFQVQRIILFIGAFIFVITFSTICSTPQKNNKKSFWKKRDFNFGNLQEGKKYSFQIKFNNDSLQKIVILSLEPSCGCVGAFIENPVIEPGKEINIRITLNTIGKNGKIFKIVRVNVENSSKPLILNIRANVKHGKNKLIDSKVIFRGNCKKCHIGRNIELKHGEILYNAICYMCHKEARTLSGKYRAYLVQSISNGIAGTSMPGFFKKNGGPLNLLQINSLAGFIKKNR